MAKFYDEMIAADPILRSQHDLIDEMARGIAPLAIVDPRKAIVKLVEMCMSDLSRAPMMAAFALIRIALAPYPDRDEHADKVHGEGV